MSMVITARQYFFLCSHSSCTLKILRRNLNSLSLTHTHSHSLYLTHTHTHTHPHSHTHTQTHTLSLSLTHTHTHTHTPTRPCVSPLNSIPLLETSQHTARVESCFRGKPIPRVRRED